MFGAGNIDILSALVGGAVIGAIWLAFYLATDEDWREALLADPDGDTGLESYLPEELAAPGEMFAGGASEAPSTADTHTDTRQVHTHGGGSV